MKLLSLFKSAYDKMSTTYHAEPEMAFLAAVKQRKNAWLVADCRPSVGVGQRTLLYHAKS